MEGAGAGVRLEGEACMVVSAIDYSNHMSLVRDVYIYVVEPGLVRALDY